MITADAEARQIAEIEEYVERLERVDAGVRALESSSMYQFLVASLAGLTGERAVLEGVTAERVRSALGTLTRLLDARPAVAQPLQRARALRGGRGELGAAQLEDAREILRIFTTPSIHLDAPAAPPAPGAVARDDTLVSPEELLEATWRAVETMRGVVSAVEAAQARLDVPVVRMEEEVVELRSMIELVNAAAADAVAARAGLDAVDVELGAARARIARDPLGMAPEDAGNLEATLAPRLAGVRAHLTALAMLRARVDRGLTRASRMRKVLHDVHGEAQWAASAMRAAFAGACAPVPVRDDLIAGLDIWRTQIELGMAAGRWSWTLVGIEQWTQTCAAYEAADRAVITALAELSARQADLEARLSERKAELNELARRGAPADAAISTVAQNAARAMAKRPLPLDIARAAVEALERVLAARARPSV